MAANSCPRCGGAVASDIVGGFCPACLIGAADGMSAIDESDAPSPFKDRRFGDYVLGRQLGGGGMGIVYEAHQVSLNRKVALKFIRDSQIASPTLLRRFTLEAEATARLHHPGIVGIHEIGEVEGHPYISMDLVEGDNLRFAMAAGRFTLKQRSDSKSNGRSVQVEIARLMAKTARAVHHAHTRGVLHRDLKPANILIDRQGEPRLTDFGLAKILRQTTEERLESSLTPKTEIAGTATYMSPEQASSDETSSASDVYGLGAVLYELLTGQPPFKGATLFETLKQVQQQPPRRPRTINPLAHRDLETICLKCLEKNPSFRYASAEALAEDLEHWIDHKPIHARPPGAAIRVHRWVRRNPPGAALIVTLFTALAITSALLGINQAQKRKVELQQSFLFEEKVRQLNQFWNDPERSEILITANDLAILTNRDPVDDPDALPLTLGASISFDPVNVAHQSYAPLLTVVESAMRRLGRIVKFDLKIFKYTGSEIEPILAGRVDFMVMETTSYVEARRRNPKVTPIAVVNRRLDGAIVTRTDTGIQSLSNLRGRTFAFDDASSSITVSMKSRLIDAGVYRSDLLGITNVVTEDNPPKPGVRRAHYRHRFRVTSAAVLKGEADAGLTSLRQFEFDKHSGLKLLADVQSTPRVFVARVDLDDDLVVAFRNALPVAHNLVDGRKLADNLEWDSIFPGAILVDDSYFNELREAMRKAARFDGLPDPFLPDANK